MAPPSASRINARAAKDPAFLKRALKNPGLRAKLDPKYLSGTQRQQRLLNTRLNAPIVQGSSTTERDLAHEAQAAQTVRYAPQESALNQQLGVAQTTERDTGSLYDQYQAALQAHAAKVQGFQAGQQQALAQAAAGITGLSGQQGAEMQQAANAQAAQTGVAPAGDLTSLASNAAATRQALMGSFQAQAAQTGAAANTYADARANVVAPVEKLGALAQARGRTRDVRQKLTDLKTEEGAFNQQFRDTRRQDEFKNVLAASTLNVNMQKAQADIATKTATAAANTPEGAAAKTSATASASTAAKYGYTAHQWAMLGPTARNKIITAAKKTSGGGSDTVYTQGPFAGRKKSEIAGLSDSERQKIVNDYNKGKGKGKDGSSGNGPNWHTPGETGAAMTQLTGLKQAATAARSGKPFVPGHAGQRPLDRHKAAQKILSYGPIASKLKDPVLVSAALDAVYDGHISPATIKKLIAAGYKPSQVANALGVPTGRKGRSAPRPTPVTSKPAAGLIPATPGGRR